MGIINLLDTQTANLIAAGEVVERPASVVKELMENSVDAGAKKITVEIKNGGVSFIRVTDDGIGMSPEDALNCVQRHATSKISGPEDLSGISTLGFRGEALAAIASVSKFTVYTKRKEDSIGTLASFEPNVAPVISEAGCPDGTTVTVSELFFNVPARRKFLKKDFSEALAVGGIVDKIALSHPEISVKFIVDNKTKYTTKGDGKLGNAVYCVLGKQFYDTLAPVVSGYSNYDVEINGFICKPECGRSNRNMQYFFLNGRTIRSKTACAALEEAYKTYMPDGNFPTCLLFIDVDVRTVDVNVHPTKQEVKFTNDKMIFEAVYFAVKNTLSCMTSRPDLSMNKVDSYTEKGRELDRAFVPVKDRTEDNSAESLPKIDESFTYSTDGEGNVFKNVPAPTIFRSMNVNAASDFYTLPPEENENVSKSESSAENEVAAALFAAEQKPEYKIIGEAYNCYIFVELKDRILVIDKHAAHERILYNEIIKQKIDASQMLLEPISIYLSKAELEAISEHLDEINENGFELEIFGSDTVLLRKFPICLVDSDPVAFVESLAGALYEGRGKVTVRGAAYERALFTAACKAAMKGGQKTNSMQNEWVVERVINDNAVRYCPHGRPVAYEIKKSSLENQFGR